MNFILYLNSVFTHISHPLLNSPITPIVKFCNNTNKKPKVLQKLAVIHIVERRSNKRKQQSVLVVD